MHYLDYDGSPATDGAGPASDADRLQAALEALAARDQVLADRTRRLTALEDVAGRLAAVTARLEAAEQELTALRRAHSAAVATRDARLADLEQRLAGAAAGPPTPAAESRGVSPAEPWPPGQLEALVARLQSDLDLERRRNGRLATLGHEAAAADLRRLQEARDAAASRADTLERELAGIQRDTGASITEGPYAHWEQWFRHRLAERDAADLSRAQEALRHQRAVLEEKERLISLLVQRLRATGEVQEGPDDLKEIVGIGPAIEAMLHGMGITTFEQLAALTEEELDRIGEQLGVFRERIARDRWTEQAAELARRRVRLGPGLSLL